MNDKTTFEILNSYMYILMQIYKTIMACLLSVFVPQYCSETNTTCSMSNNFILSEMNEYNIFVLFFNFTTLIVFAKLYYIVSKRETYLITHCEVNHEYPNTHLNKIITKYPKIQQHLLIVNKKLYINIYVSILMFAMNTLFSCILIFYYYYDGVRSVTTLVSSVLLQTSEIYNIYTISNKILDTKQELLGLSSLLKNEIIYNDIDSKYLELDVNYLEFATHAK